ncbi:hypothetical protein KBY58_02155 [Cyanobium sp. HWJ4-Hawea]|uniref:hypothetical protein n=1 Tax=Cyanobium sp. HWJ4-Hawea TaxID=2823713 RepID=UPI0020CC2D75|nr:hypothetical protein [Cyanobium sp. HWJ4-Hawea]MCP9808235.1 hypothetical protein [Cyanobium sp. HWJ4-Hawea]
MALELPQISPLWRSSLRIWLAATLAIGIMLWSGRGSYMTLALVMAVMFVNEDDPSPAGSVGQIMAGALVGILTAMVLHEISTDWVVLGISLLVSGVLLRSLGLTKGLSVGYLCAWAVEVLHHGKQFSWQTIFDLALAVAVGILMAQLATWALWPRQPLQKLPGLEAGIASQLSQQITAMQQWLDGGGKAPPPLRSQELLPRILLLQQLRNQRQTGANSSQKIRLLSRWYQAGSILRQLLRQWLLLEQLLLQLPAPLQQRGDNALIEITLADLAKCLQAPASPTPGKPLASEAQIWLDHATSLGASKPLVLAIGQQCRVLQQLANGRALLKTAVGQLSATVR